MTHSRMTIMRSNRTLLATALVLASSCSTPSRADRHEGLTVRLTRNAWEHQGIGLDSMADLYRHLDRYGPRAEPARSVALNADHDVSYEHVLSKFGNLSLWGYNTLLPGNWKQRPYQCHFVDVSDLSDSWGATPASVGVKPV
jgi:hypothetical protein